ncbi:hypothetical protein LZ630_08650, partial [Aeromonas caviae]|nr:hypothetical protein [Aeromonas caviae]
QQATKAVNDSAKQAASSAAAISAATSAQQQAAKAVQQQGEKREATSGTLSDQARADAEAELEKLLN